MKRIFFAILLAGVLSGCTLIDQFVDTSSLAVLDEVRAKGVEVEDRILDSAADAADKYCITPKLVRHWLRGAINSRTETATVIVLCGDEEMS